MKSLNLPLLSGTFAFALALCATSQAAVIAVMDGGNPATHNTVIDRSTAGDSAVGITGSFSADNPSYADGTSSYFNSTQFAYSTSGMPETASKTATWTFSSLVNGTVWDVYATWVQQGNRATDAPYTVNGITVDINQELAPAANLVLSDTDSAGTANFNFQKIGTATVTAGTIAISLTDDANEWVIADAVAIQQVPEPATLSLLGLGALVIITRRRH